MTDYKEAVKQLRIARNHFENADPDYIDAAIYELKMAEARFSAVRKEAIT